ncbi:hypothetical protein [Candidatus Laterigemmans baculatus]|uniref:hypothetical protein n=1 Tax=Candidatus Laterigemmans baculatus TaxID=2770505 RepID=UPI0013DA6F8E|nr:hypothetical protein [Candidatus Laterigemmans baculatus]
MPTKNTLLTTAALGFVALAALSLQANAQNQPQKEKMMMQCPMMDALKSLQLPADAPPVLLAQDEQLQLTADQKERLREIAETARQQAREVLDEDQREQLEKAPSGPLSPMQLAHTLMKGQMGKRGDGQGKQMCPMCKKMMDQMQGHQEGKHEHSGSGQNRSNSEDR